MASWILSHARPNPTYLELGQAFLQLTQYRTLAVFSWNDVKSEIDFFALVTNGNRAILRQRRSEISHPAISFKRAITAA